MFKNLFSIKQLIAIQLVQFMALILVAINNLSIAQFSKEVTFNLVFVSLMITQAFTFARLQTAHRKQS